MVLGSTSIDATAVRRIVAQPHHLGMAKCTDPHLLLDFSMVDVGVSIWMCCCHTFGISKEMTGRDSDQSLGQMSVLLPQINIPSR